jgi:hypothetical protein
MHFDITTAIGMLAGVFYLASHFMKDMVPLRVLALASNGLFLIFSVLHTHFDITQLIELPEFLLNLILLPVNTQRLVEIIRLTKQVERATVESPVSECYCRTCTYASTRPARCCSSRATWPTSLCTWPAGS